MTFKFINKTKTDYGLENKMSELRVLLEQLVSGRGITGLKWLMG